MAVAVSLARAVTDRKVIPLRLDGRVRELPPRLPVIGVGLPGGPVRAHQHRPCGHRRHLPPGEDPQVGAHREQARVVSRQVRTVRIVLGARIRGSIRPSKGESGA